VEDFGFIPSKYLEEPDYSELFMKITASLNDNSIHTLIEEEGAIEKILYHQLRFSSYLSAHSRLLH